MPTGVIGQDFRNVASGGTVTTITTGGKTYRVHSCTSNGTFTVSRGLIPFEVLVVGGGGGGGADNNWHGSGGGGGFDTQVTQALANGDHTVTRGSGGGGGTGTNSYGAAGGTSSIGSITAAGGAGGKPAGVTPSFPEGGASNGGTSNIRTGSNVSYGTGGGPGSGGNASGAANTGNGGNGGFTPSAQTGGTGGSGIIVVRYEVLA